MVGQRLAYGQEVVVVVTEYHAAPDDAHLGHPGQFLFSLAHPVLRRFAVDSALQAVRATTQMRAQLRQDHTCATAPGGECRRQPGHAAARHQHIAMDVLVHITVLVFLLRRGTETTGLADKTLVPHPGLGRPHKGLVIEPGREQRRKPAVDGKQMFTRAGPGVDACRLQALVQLHLGHLGVGNGPGTTFQLHQRRGFFDAGTHDGARAVVFPGARQHGLASRQHGRGQRVSGKAAVAAAVELEAQRARAVKAAAGRRYANTAHAKSPAFGAPPSEPPPAGPLLPMASEVLPSGFSPGL